MVDAKFAQDTLARLGRCLEYWATQGYQFVALPWVIDSRYTEATKPPCVVANDVQTAHGNLVASGEQSFLMLCEQNLLPEGHQFIGWTPCFRQEPVFDVLHSFYFLKAELYEKVADRVVAQLALERMIAQAQAWFRQEITALRAPDLLLLEVISSSQVDILYAGIELGSYGIREFSGQMYVYGTACAEPRFQLAVNAFRKLPD